MLNGIPPNSGPLLGIAPVVRKADFALANLEVPLTDARTPTARKTAAELRARTQFVLKADPRHLAALKNAGFDAVSLANNHAMDYGPRGIAQERALLTKNGIRFAGAGPGGVSAAALTVVTSPDGFRLGLLSALAFVGRGALAKCGPAGPRTPGVNVLSFNGTIDEAARAKLQSWIGGARDRCDYLVVALHWGIERQTKPTSYQKALGHAVAEAGADLVWGAHPHVLQTTETYRGVPILYSTGNLVSALPAKTALFRLSIDRHRTKGWSAMPATISGGKVSFDAPAERSRRRGRIIKPKAARAAKP